MNNILGIIVSFLFIFLVIAFGKVFEKLGKEASRKFIHIALCNWWFIAMAFFDNVIYASIVPACFIIINTISYKTKLLETMERETNDGFGTIYYAIALLILVIISFGICKNPQLGLPGVLIMGYGDGLACVLGERIKSKKYKVGNTTKSIAGSITMFLIAFVIYIITNYAYNFNIPILKLLLASIVVTILEAVSIKGTDNITVPIVASSILLLF